MEWRTGPGDAAGFRESAPCSPNIFLHYALDLWVHQWRKRYARGRVIVVRYCTTTFVMGFQYEADARADAGMNLKERLAKFKLALHEQKTRTYRVRQALK